MYFVCLPKLTGLNLAMAMAFLLATPAFCQGMLEYGGLMAAPRGVPSQKTVGDMTQGYGVIPKLVPGETNGLPGRFAHIDLVPDKPKYDAKQSALMISKAATDLKQAQQIMGSKTARSAADLKRAEALTREAISLHNSLWGYKDPTIPSLLNRLGVIYEELKQPTTAESCYSNALVYINKRCGPGSPERLETLGHMAHLRIGENKLSESLNLQQQVTLIKERKNGASDPGTIESRLAWAETARALDKPDAADIYKKCLTDINAAGNKINPEATAKLKSQIIAAYTEVLKKQGREDEAKALITGENSASAPPPAAVSTPDTASTDKTSSK